MNKLYKNIKPKLAILSHLFKVPSKSLSIGSTNDLQAHIAGCGGHGKS